MRPTRKAINNLSLLKNIIILKAPIQSGIKHLCTSRAQNDAHPVAQNNVLEATLSHSTQAQRARVHIEKFKAQRKEFKAQWKEILMRSVLNIFDSLMSLFF